MSAARRPAADEIVVVSRDHGLPYSKGLMAQSMMAAGLVPARAYDLAKLVEGRLQERAQSEIGVDVLREVAQAVLAEHESEHVIRRFRQWHRLGALDRPLIVLLGGATGTGKSTVASLAAHRLGITRVAATDMIRQILRACFDRSFMPAVHYSSFEVDAAVRLRAQAGEDSEMLGFLRQVENVSTGVRALVERTVAEGEPMVLEGVHLVPGLLPPESISGGHVVSLVLAVEDEEVHRSHIALRGTGTSRRPSERYLKRFQTIRKLQGYLVERAEEAGVPVLYNAGLDESVAAVTEAVLDAVAAVDGPPGAVTS